jgi:serine/threonine-protein kinase
MTRLFRRLAANLSPSYRLRCALGCGGSARIFVADDRRRQCRVAVKVLREELAASVSAKRFLAEVRIAAQLRHPNIVPLYDSGSVDGLPFYVMPLVDGESLREYLERAGRIPVHRALSITAEIAEGLEYAHARHVIHRDIKPENIMLASDRALILDFGIALALHATSGARLTSPGLVTGTPEYMSPEQALGASVIDGRSDVYALACVAYEMLCGQPPFVGPPQGVIARHISVEATPIEQRCADVPAGVSATLARALAKKPGDRFLTPGAFVSALNSAWRAPGRDLPVGTPSSLREA